MDSTIPRGLPNRMFKCKVILLFWTGDYPALALVSGTHSKVCHWCTLKSINIPEASRRMWYGHRQYLPGTLFVLPV